jgi:hypothetical protein
MTPPEDREGGGKKRLTSGKFGPRHHDGDAQDNQDGRLLQETRTRAMIVCGFEDVREHKPAVSGKKSCASCASM